MIPQSQPIHADGLLTHTTSIVLAYLSNASLPSDQLPRFVSGVYRALSDAQRSIVEPTPRRDTAETQTVFPEYIVCLEDGKRFKTLKRHLRTHYNLTPEQYRARWNLAPDYPMTAPAYSHRRASIARAQAKQTED